MKIAIITCTTPNREWLYNITNPGKIKFCKKFNYDYIFRTDLYYDNTLLPGWNKIKFISDTLKDYDYVVWMDDDASFIKFDEDIISKAIIELNNKSILMCKDLNGFNSGVIIIKSNEFSRFMFCYIWDNRDMFVKKYAAIQKYYMEQPAIIELMNKFPEHIFIGNGKIYNAYDSCYCISEQNQRSENTYILHIACGVWKDNNKDIIKNLFTENLNI